MNFASLRIITLDSKKIADFYEKITGIKAKHHTEDFAELRSQSFVLAIGSTRTIQLFGSNDIALAASNRSLIIEFRVGDVDAEHRKISEIPDIEIVQEPTDMPWGNRSLLFRDPDGNLVNFFAPVSANQ